MKPESRYKIPSLESFINRIIKFIFYYRLPIIIMFLIIILCFIFWNPFNETKLKNGILILTSGSIMVGIFYSIVNYEHNYYKSQEENKLSQKLLSFNVAFEWHKPNIVEHLKIIKQLYEEHKNLIYENRATDFSKLLEENEVARSSIVSIFNYLESVAVGVKCEVMDCDLIKECFKSLFIQFYKDYEFYISYRRKKEGSSSAWINFTNLAQKWHNES